MSLQLSSEHTLCPDWSLFTQIKTTIEKARQLNSPETKPCNKFRFGHRTWLQCTLQVLCTKLYRQACLYPKSTSKFNTLKIGTDSRAQRNAVFRLTNSDTPVSHKEGKRGNPWVKGWRQKVRGESKRICHGGAVPEGQFPSEDKEQGWRSLMTEKMKWLNVLPSGLLKSTI